MMFRKPVMEKVFIVVIDHMDEYGNRIANVYNSREKAENSDAFDEPFQSVKIEERKVI